ncbi:MAG: cytochrome d ubiquinol oxidase subunit II [Leptospirales bacterium]
MLDYATLKVLWWGIVLFILSVFFITDGFDMGIAFLLPWIGRNDIQRRVLLNSIGPHWEGNQVWFITAGGTLFAAWPLVYATAFSSFYMAMFLVLWTLFLRPVGFDYRSKLENTRWRTFWDGGLVASGTVPPVIFGVAFGNLLEGVPFRFDSTLHSYTTGTFWGLLNPFTLLCGLVSLLMMTFHGTNYLFLKTEGVLKERARKWSLILGPGLGGVFAISGLWAYRYVPGYRIISAPGHQTVPDPLNKVVVREMGAWFLNSHAHPILWSIPALVYVGILIGISGVLIARPILAFLGSSLSGTAIILTAASSMFPFILPSSLDPRSSLTVWDAVSSHLTLLLMFWASLILVPIVVAYTGWAYRILRGPVTEEAVQKEKQTLY